MGTEKLRGIVLREQAKGESNKQIVLLAQGVGRVLLSARGARRAKSKLLAATQLFCYADFVVYEGKGFYSVTQAELKNSFYGLRLDMDKFSEGMYLAELTERSCFTVKSTAQRIAFLFRMPSEGRFGLCWKERAARRLAFSFPPKHSNS